MSTRALLIAASALDGAGEVLSTPAGVNIDLLRSYGPRRDDNAAGPYVSEMLPRR